MTEDLIALIGNDTAAADQYFATFQRGEHLEPEKMLLLAVLQDAIHCYRKFSAARARAGREQFREAQNWIMGVDKGWIFGFDNVCELLGLDPQYVRRGLSEWRAQQENRGKPTKGEGLRRRAA
jgi:hypothetical protein